MIVLSSQCCGIQVRNLKSGGKSNRAASSRKKAFYIFSLTDFMHSVITSDFLKTFMYGPYVM